jgi:hypothetical protein
LKVHRVTGLAPRRLHAQRLAGEPFKSPLEAVRWFGAMQSQDYTGAKWALGQRSHGTTDAELDRLFDEGSILRTHVMRPTWHFVLPEDIRWLLDLTGSRIRLGLAARYRQLELDEKAVARASAAFASALGGGKHLTRGELGEVLRAARVSPEGQRLPHLLMRAELDGLIVSGPRRGKEFTYALVDERVPRARVLERAEALGELARRYFLSHGPAQLQDFRWWSGLTAADARSGIALAGAALERRAVDGKDYWFNVGTGTGQVGTRRAHLLPNYDEYSVGYRDRAAMIPADVPFDPSFFSFGSVLSNVLTIDGRVRGAWRRVSAGGAVRVELRVLEHLTPPEVAAAEKAGGLMSRFLERPLELAWQR